jgi:hypothetical protein
MRNVKEYSAGSMPSLLVITNDGLVINIYTL